MGVCYVLHRLDPTSIEQISQYAAQDQDRPAAQIVDFLKSLDGPSLDSLDEDSWEEVEERISSEGWNYALRAAASRETWDLDKSLDRPAGGIEAILEILPNRETLQRCFHSTTCDFDLPSIFAMKEYGLIGVTKTETVVEALETIEKFATHEAVSNIQLGFWRGFFGGRATLNAWRDDDYLWGNWLSLVEAMQKTVASRCWLGVEVY